MYSIVRKVTLFIQPGLIKILLFLVKLISPSKTIIQGQFTFSEDGLYTFTNCDFINNERFIQAYNAGKATDSWGRDIRWRSHVTAWAASHGAALDGDFVECGVNRGGSAMVAATYVDFRKLNKTFYLMDTYKGLDNSFVTAEEKAMGILNFNHMYSECYEAVQETFKDFTNVKIIRGTIPDTLPQVDVTKISYLSIDMNNKIPEIAAAEYFWDKLVSGAVIVLDDYGWNRHKEQKIAFDRFAAARGVEVLSLPTGQGLIIKS